MLVKRKHFPIKQLSFWVTRGVNDEELYDKMKVRGDII